MENHDPKTSPKTSPKTLTNVTLKSPNSKNSLSVTGTPPNRLRVPEPFKFAERYKSPTDTVMSPISKGLLARSRKTRPLLPPSKNHDKILDLDSKGVGLSALSQTCSYGSGDFLLVKQN